MDGASISCMCNVRVMSRVRGQTCIMYKHIFPPQLPTHHPHVETVHVVELKSKKYSGLFKCLWMFARGGNHAELK